MGYLSSHQSNLATNTPILYLPDCSYSSAIYWLISVSESPCVQALVLNLNSLGSVVRRCKRYQRCALRRHCEDPGLFLTLFSHFDCEVCNFDVPWISMWYATTVPKAIGTTKHRLKPESMIQGKPCPSIRISCGNWDPTSIDIFFYLHGKPFFSFPFSFLLSLSSIWISTRFLTISTQEACHWTQDLSTLSVLVKGAASGRGLRFCPCSSRRWMHCCFFHEWMFCAAPSSAVPIKTSGSQALAGMLSLGELARV